MGHRYKQTKKKTTNFISGYHELTKHYGAELPQSLTTYKKMASIKMEPGPYFVVHRGQTVQNRWTLHLKNYISDGSEFTKQYSAEIF